MLLEIVASKGCTPKFRNFLISFFDGPTLKLMEKENHLASVDKFYQRLWKLNALSEVASKTKQRFEKNRDTLFTFLKHDGGAVEQR
jgi:hypothetical protein